MNTVSSFAPRNWEDLPLVLTAKEAAQVLRVRPRTITNMLCSGRLRGTRIGAKEWRITRSELMRFMGERIMPSKASQETEETAQAVQGETGTDTAWEFDGLFELAGMVKDAPPDMSSNKHKYLAEVYAA